MAVSTHVSEIGPPDIRALVLPVLSALPGAAASSLPATALLPLLAPILRQRVQLLSDASTEPWIRLFTYDASQVAKLTEIAQGGSLEPHPVSGEIEVDWEDQVRVLYKRVDAETLQALVVLPTFPLFVRLVYCIGDSQGGTYDWRVGEVGVSAEGDVEASSSLVDAEQAFAARATLSKKQPNTVGAGKGTATARRCAADDKDEADDEDYWARYDATPARTPAVPHTTAQAGAAPAPNDADYYARYDSVQPAMDNHDPDEEAAQQALGVPLAPAAPPLGLACPRIREPNLRGGPDEQTGGVWALAADARQRSVSLLSARSAEDEERTAALMHPRPESSASSNGSLTVARLEETAGRREQSEFGVKQHISRSIRSLFLLSRAAGIDREEFEAMIKTELDVLGMVEHDM